jgi:hypothetical protein
MFNPIVLGHGGPAKVGFFAARAGMLYRAKPVKQSIA